MDNYDKLYKQYQEASKNSEAKDFPAMDKVWTRLEDKLDAKVHKKESKTWKKLAIAASVLLLVSLGYQVLKPNEITNNQQNEVVVTPKDSATTISPQIIQEQKTITEEAIVTNEKPNPIIRKNADAILKKQLNDQEPVGYHPQVNPKIMSGAVILHDTIKSERTDMELAKSKQKATPFANRIFEAKTVQKEELDDKMVTGFTASSSTAKKAQSKPDPLVVVDGEAVKSGLKNVNADEVESIVSLPDPLYIINGVHYSEESLFGKNPTSPYAPLNKQAIESISILQGEEAIKAYGEKGTKGVVIISTKNGKPAIRK